MSQLPTGWSAAPIGILCTLKNGRAFKSTEWQTNGIPIVRIQNLNNPAATYNYFGGQFEDRHYLRGGELLFAWSGTPGTSFGAHIWGGGEAVLNQHIFRVDFDETSLDKRFLRYAINQKLEELIGIAHGAVGLRHVTKGKFESTEVLIPPFAEQKRIADKLDAVLARVDACRERLDRLHATLKYLRQSILAAAISGKLTEKWRDQNAVDQSGNVLLEKLRKQHAERNSTSGVRQEIGRQNNPIRGASVSSADFDVESLSASLPDSWGHACGAEVVQPGADIVYGIVQPGPKLDAGVPYVRGMDIEQGRILVSQLLKTSPEIAARYSRAAIKAGDVLLGIIRATKVAIVPSALDGANITQGTARFRPSDSIRSRYLAAVLEAPATQRWLHAHYRGIDMPGLNLADVRRVPIPLPPIREQDEIVRLVEALLGLSERLEARYTVAREQVGRIIPAVLGKAFRGELVPQDFNDEPATELLERIRASRAEDKAKPKRHTKSRRVPVTKLTTDAVKAIIQRLPADGFTFDDLRDEVSSEYEALKDIVFALLADPRSGLKQVFHVEAGAMRFVRTKP